jgi:hypothetical protein
VKKYLYRLANSAAPAVQPDVKFNAPSDAKAKSQCRRVFRRATAKTPIGAVSLMLFVLNTTTGAETFIGLLEPCEGTHEPKWTHEISK